MKIDAITVYTYKNRSITRKGWCSKFFYICVYWKLFHAANV